MENTHPQNPGFDRQEIEKIRLQCQQLNQPYVLNDEEPQGDEFAHFWFVGKYEGRAVIFDAVMYTLRLHHSSVLYEMAEEKAAARFPSYKRWDFEEDENGDIRLPDDLDEDVELFKAETMDELEESESVKVKEYVNIDPDFDYGLALEVCLNIDEITPQSIARFVTEFNANTLVLDDTLYAFRYEDDEE